MKRNNVGWHTYWVSLPCECDHLCYRWNVSSHSKKTVGGMNFWGQTCFPVKTRSKLQRAYWFLNILWNILDSIFSSYLTRNIFFPVTVLLWYLQCVLLTYKTISVLDATFVATFFLFPFILEITASKYIPQIAVD